MGDSSLDIQEKQVNKILDEICSVCVLKKEISEFGKDKRLKNGLTKRCKLCICKYHKKWRFKKRKKHLSGRRKYYRKNKEKMIRKCIEYKQTEIGKSSARKANLKYYYGLSEETYNNLLKKQGYCCAICKSTTPKSKHKN